MTPPATSSPPDRQTVEERLQTLADEVSQQHADIIERLHVMEIAAERSRRLPPTLYSALLGVAVTVVGTGSMLYSRLEVNGYQASKALELYESSYGSVATTKEGCSKLERLVDAIQVSLSEGNKLMALTMKRVDMIEERNRRMDAQRDSLKAKCLVPVPNGEAR